MVSQRPLQTLVLLTLLVLLFKLLALTTFTVTQTQTTQASTLTLLLLQLALTQWVATRSTTLLLLRLQQMLLTKVTWTVLHRASLYLLAQKLPQPHLLQLTGHTQPEQLELMVEQVLALLLFTQLVERLLLTVTLLQLETAFLLRTKQLLYKTVSIQ
jgi:hypothetical protein